MWMLVACVEDVVPEEAISFVVPPADVGTPLTTGTGFNPADGDALGAAFASALPVFGGGNPAWRTPMDAWDLLMPETVRDPASCPQELVDGDAHRWIGGCRSSQGYGFSGAVTEREWSDGEADRYRWEGEIEAIADRDDPSFDRVRIAGALEQSVPLAGTVTQHLDVNLSVIVEGYWEQRDPDDPRLATWASWTLSGSLEQRDGFWTASVAADIGPGGGFGFESAGLTEEPECAIEFAGEARLSEDVSATFDGAAGCDGCADVASAAGIVPACGG